MHYSAKRSLAIACRLSVCPSVTLVEGSHSLRCKSRKLIARTISPTPSLFVAQRTSDYSQGNMGKFRGDPEVVWGKVVRWSKKAAISLKRVEIEMESLYRNSPTLFRTVPSRAPMASFSPRLVIRNAHPKLQSLLSQERVNGLQI